MSLKGFKAKNHPQQTRGLLAQNSLWEERDRLDDTDDRAVPPELFDALGRRFEFTVDAAASAENARLPRYWTVEDDGLAQSWAGERIWCNPPYSNIEPWVLKAWRETEAELVVMLLPANRTEQRWWQELVEPHRDRGGRLAVEFLPGRIRFLKPGYLRPGPNERPPFGCCLLIWSGA